MCCKGEIGLDTILSIPIDWQSVAMQYQLKKDFATIVGEELIPTSTPLQVRYRLKHRQDTDSSSPSEPAIR